MDRGKLSHGLNISKKSTSLTSKPKAPLSKAKGFNAFGGGGSDDDDDSDDDDTLSRLKGAKPSSFSNSNSNSHRPPSPARKNMMAKAATTGSGLKTEMEELDASIYDYDGAWDNMNAIERKKTEKRNADAAERKPRYMGNLLAAAEVRKRDQLRAKERMLQKEREEEGEEFADKEKFVTGAYKKQQEDMKKMEEDEKKKEEGMAKKSQGMTSFYRNMLDRTEEKHGELVDMAEREASNNESREKEDITKNRTEAEIAREMNTKSTGAVQLNDEGQIVDKRQLLSAGLNVQPKKPSANSSSSRDATPSNYNRRPENAYNNRDARIKRQERQQSMLDRQMESSQKRAAESEEFARKAMENEAKVRKTTSEDIKSAKERYLERKRLAAAASNNSGV